MKINIHDIQFQTLPQLFKEYKAENPHGTMSKYTQLPDSWHVQNVYQRDGSNVLDIVIPFLSTLPLNTKGENNTINGKNFWVDNFDIQDPWVQGLAIFLAEMDARGCVVKHQNTPTGTTYCALVPLILYAHKLYNDIPYSQWDRNTLHAVVNKLLCQSMLSTPDVYTVEELLNFRTRGLTTSTGKSKSLLGNCPNSITGATNFNSLTNLARAMLCQTWVANVALRHKYMVLNPLDWDDMPKSLDEDIFQATEPKPVAKSTSKHELTLPWDI